MDGGAPLSRSAIERIAQSLRADKPKEIGGVLELNGAGTLDLRRVSGDGRVASVSIPVAPIMMHTHPGTCVNYCRRVRTARGRVVRRCVRTSAACAFGTPSATDLLHFVQLGLEGRCHAHLIATKQGSVFVLYLTPGIARGLANVAPGDLDRYTRRAAAERGYDAGSPSASRKNARALALAVAARASGLAHRLEDAFSRDFDRVQYGTFVRKWLRAMRAFSVAGHRVLDVRIFRSMREARVLLPPGRRASVGPATARFDAAASGWTLPALLGGGAARRTRTAARGATNRRLTPERCKPCSRALARRHASRRNRHRHLRGGRRG